MNQHDLTLSVCEQTHNSQYQGILSKYARVFNKFV